MKNLKYLLLLIPFLFISEVKALTLDTQDITWYYRKTADESTLLNTIQSVNTPVKIVNGEYLNGFTTRQDFTFTKGLQYLVSYKLILMYYEPLDSAFRSDTVDRLIDLSWVDSDFRLLNTNVNQTKYLCEADLCFREFTFSQQVLTLNNTGGIRFGVYPSEAKSLGFYSPPTPPAVEFSLSSYISIEENSSSVIIDQNNQIIDGQNGINDNITNSTNTITGSIGETEDNINSNIDDMEDAIIDSNNQTQDVIKDQFNNCRDSVNLWGNINWLTSTYSYFELPKENTYYTLSIKLKDGATIPSDLFLGFTEYGLYNSSQNVKWLIQSGGVVNYNIKDNFYYLNNFDTDVFLNYISVFPARYINTLSDYFDIQLEEGNNFTNYEAYGEEVCSNRIDETNDKLDNLTGAITDDSSPNIDGLADSAGWLPAGPLDSVLNLPLSLFNSLTTNLNKSCSSISLPLPFVNKNLSIPCINSLYEKIGVSTFITWLGVIVSGFMLYTYLLKLYKWVEDRISLNETHSVDNWGGL